MRDNGNFHLAETKAKFESIMAELLCRIQTLTGNIADYLGSEL